MTVRVTFGKHRGSLLTNLPDNYLAWLCDPAGPDEDFVKRNKMFFKKAHEEYTRRLRGDPIAPPKGALDNGSRKFLVPLVDAGYKTLAKIHHPDKGGSAKEMKDLTALRAYLKGL